MEYCVYKIGEICELKAGGDAPKIYSKTQTEEFPFPIYSNGVENSGLYGYTSKPRINGDTITISARGNIGTPFYRKEPFLPIVRLIALIPNKRVFPKYLYYYLKTISLGGTGAAQQQITVPMLSKEKIVVFENVDYQKKVATILSKYDELIEMNNQRIKKLEQAAEELYKEWFVRFRFPNYQNTEFENGIPIRWTTQTLGEFGISLESGKRPKGGIDSTLADGVPSLGAECINSLAEYDYSTTKYVPRDFFESMKSGINTDKEILLYKDGAYIGRTTLFRDGFPFKTYSINEHVFFVRPKNMDYFNFLYFTIHQEAYFILMQNLNRNAAQPGLSKPDINRVKITVPIQEIVCKFNELIEPILKEVFALSKQNTNLIKQRDYLLPRLMSGKLEV